MAEQIILKELAGTEDLLIGEGTVTQSRAGMDVTITKLTIPAVVGIYSDLASVDTSKYSIAIVSASGSIWKYEESEWKPSRGVVNVKDFGISPNPGATIPETITKSNEILTAVSTLSNTTIQIPEDINFDGQTLYDGLTNYNKILTSVNDLGYSYPGYNSKGSVLASNDTEDNDSRQLIQSGHNASLTMFNSQLDNTGTGGSGQSESSEEGKCSLSLIAGYREVNGRQTFNPSSRIQRYRTNNVGPIHIGIQHPIVENSADDPYLSGNVRTLFDFDAFGNASFGGMSTEKFYNLLIAPSLVNTPEDIQNKTTLGIWNLKASQDGAKLEFVARDSLNVNTSLGITYNDGNLLIIPESSEEGSYSGKLEQVVIGGDVTAGQNRTTPLSNASAYKAFTDGNKGFLHGISTLSTAKSATMVFLDVASATTSFFFQKMRNYTNNDVFTINGLGDVTANSYTPFTGCHFFYSDSDIEVGMAVDLIDYLPIDIINNKGKDNEFKAHLNGKVGLSGLKSKVCVGIVHSSLRLEDDTYMISVAAVGDNKSGSLKGFKVNNENGIIEAGDILCTSSTSGELMKLAEGEPETIVRFKTMSSPDENNIVYGYFK